MAFSLSRQKTAGPYRILPTFEIRLFSRNLYVRQTSTALQAASFYRLRRLYREEVLPQSLPQGPSAYHSGSFPSSQSGTAPAAELQARQAEQTNAASAVRFIAFLLFMGCDKKGLSYDSPFLAIDMGKGCNNYLCCSGRLKGKSSTSRIDGLLVKNMTKRSIPIPRPPVGGKPYSKARQ